MGRSHLKATTGVCVLVRDKMNTKIDASALPQKSTGVRLQRMMISYSIVSALVGQSFLRKEVIDEN